jgi:hypothetical protein
MILLSVGKYKRGRVNRPQYEVYQDKTNNLVKELKEKFSKKINITPRGFNVEKYLNSRKHFFYNQLS